MERIRAGDLVACAAPPGAWWLELLSDAWDAGAAVLPIDPRLSPGARAALIDIARPTLHIDGAGLQAGDAAALERLNGGPIGSGTALVLMTSGSTGPAKAVVLSRGAVRAAVAASAERLRFGRATTLQCPIPVAHAGGMMMVVRALLLELEISFDPDPLTTTSRWTSIVPTQLARIVADPRVLADDLPLEGRGFLVGGARLNPDLQRRAEDLGAWVVPTYGMTETCGGIVYDGMPLDDVAVRIADDETIELRTPTLFDGYRTATGFQAMKPAGGWYRTRDRGRFEAGRIDVLGRIDDVLVTGGEKADPAAIEAILRAQPGVATATVTGEPDGEWGTRIVADLTLEANAALDPDTLSGAVRDALGPHAVPRAFRIALP